MCSSQKRCAPLGCHSKDSARSKFAVGHGVSLSDGCLHVTSEQVTSYGLIQRWNASLSGACRSSIQEIPGASSDFSHDAVRDVLTVAVRTPQRFLHWCVGAALQPPGICQDICTRHLHLVCRHVLFGSFGWVTSAGPHPASPPPCSGWGKIKVNSSETLSIFGDKCPQNGSKNEQRAPRTSMGCPR
jgi:hypothetical protein